MPFWLGAAIVFVYGAVVGSFLNVCIWRMPNDESIIRPPSHCPKCKTRLRFADLVPLVSFLVIGRKCRHCGAPIGWRYFLVELVTALMFVALYAKYQFRVDFFVFALFSAALIAVFFIDLEHWIIPDQLSVFGMLLGVGRDVFGLVTGEAGHTVLRIPIPLTSVYVPMLWSIVGLLACGAIFFAIVMVAELYYKKEAMGFGDVKLAAAIGSVFAGQAAAVLGLGLALLSFFIAVFVGSMIGIGIAATRRVALKGLAVPFGPMMVAGVFATVFFGNEIIAAYMGYLHRGGL